ncbi:hypothetical protein MKW92_007793 [Papaver armeniacum]|nr:hypothetical protein MKW92_007793 [Papaver armeniacum]
MVKRFFWIKQQTVDEHNDSAAAHNNDPQIMLLSGPPSWLENKPPYLSQGLDQDPSSDICTRIQMKYVEDDEGIKKYFAAFHMHYNNEGGTFPGAAIIDDFREFFDDTNCKQRYGGNYQGRDLAMVRTLALCRDAILHANERLLLESSLVGGDKYSCKILISDTHLGDTPRSYSSIRDGFLPFSQLSQDLHAVMVHVSTGATTDALASTTESVAGRKKTAGCAKFPIALQYLMLEDIY